VKCLVKSKVSEYYNLVQLIHIICNITYNRHGVNSIPEFELKLIIKKKEFELRNFVLELELRNIEFEFELKFPTKQNPDIN